MMEYTISLDKSTRKFLCPACQKKRFVRYYDFEMKQYLPENVGRCDREVKCGYHYSAVDYFKGQFREGRGNAFKPLLKKTEYTYQFAKPSLIANETF